VRFAARSSHDSLVQCYAARFPDVRVQEGPLDDATVQGADLVVNALPAAGRHHVERLADAELADQGTWFDLNYFDAHPPGFPQAIRRGWRTVRGDGMLRAQAALAFERWTGQAPPSAPEGDGEG
jgi:shikimate 5-dehydrogenase